MSSGNGYSMSNQPAVQRMALGTLLQTSAWGEENKIKVGVPTKAPYNAHHNFKVASPGFNKHDADLNIMRKFLSNTDKTLIDEEGAQEMLTVAETVGRRGALARARTIIVNQLSDPATSPYFKVLPPKEMSEAEVAGVQQSVLILGYTPMVEAPEFSPPHFITFKTQIYQSSSFRFNIGFRYQAEHLLTTGGIELVDQFAKRTVGNIIQFMEQMVMASLMRVQDAYVGAKILYRESVSSMEELVDRIRYNGPTTGGSFLMSKKMVGILQKEDGLSYLLNWVKDVTLSNDAKVDVLFHPPGMFRDIAYEYTDYSHNGPRANTAADQGAQFVESKIRTTFGSISIIPNKTIRMNDARTDQEQMLASHMQAGHWNLLDNETYKRNAVVQSTRGLDSSAHRFASGINDLWFLNFGEPSITKEKQTYSEIASAAVCFDEHGELNDRVFSKLNTVDKVHNYAIENLNVNITDPHTFKADPWLVRSGSVYKKVSMVGNQDVYYTSVEDTIFAVETAYNIIRKSTTETATEGLSKMMKLAEQNFNVSPDANGEVEAFWDAIAWENVNRAKLNENESVNYIAKVRLPDLMEVMNPRKQVQRKHAYQRIDTETGQSVSLFKVPVLDTEGAGALFDTTAPIDFDAVFNARDNANVSLAGYAAAMIGGYLRVGMGLIDVWGLLFIDSNRVSAVAYAASRDIVNEYVVSFNSINAITGLAGDRVAGQVRVLMDDGILRVIDPGRDATYPYPQPETRSASVSAIDPSVLGYQFYSTPSSEYIQRLTHGHLQHIYYSTVRQTVSAYPNIGRLRQTVLAHPAYEWLDSKLLNDPDTGFGCIEGERIAFNPTTLPYPGFENMPNFTEAGFNHRSFFSIKMAALGFVQASYFYCYEDLARCRVAGVEPGRITFPGFSTIYSLHCIAEQMRDGYHGWDLVGAAPLIDQIIEADDQMFGFMNFAMDIFCPIRSSQSNQPLEPGLAFLHKKFLSKYQRIKKTQDERANALLCFSNMITETSTRNFGMMQPYTNYPLHWSVTAVSSEQGLANNVESIHKRNHVEVSFRYTDIQAIVAATPFMINKTLGEEIGSTAQTRTTGVAAVERIATYDYLQNEARSVSGPSANVDEFNFLKAEPISTKKQQIATRRGPNQRYIYSRFHHDVITRLRNSDSFLFVDAIKNASPSNPSGVSYAAGDDYPDFKLVGSAGAAESRAFYDKYLLIMDTAYNMFDAEKDIIEYRKAVYVGTQAVHDYFDYMFESPSRIGDPTRYDISQEQWNRWKTEADRLGSAMESSMSNVGLSEVSPNARLNTYLRKVREDFASSLAIRSESRVDGRKLIVTNMMLSISTKYWTAVDKQFKAMYSLPSDGMGVQFSMVRPQSRFGTGFIDVTFYPTSFQFTNNQFVERLRQYKELVAFGPGQNQTFDFHTTLMKLGGGLDESIILEDFGANEFFHMRIDAFRGNWMKRAIALAYLTARPTVDLLVNLHRYGIPSPITLLTFDPFMDFMMHGLLFAEAGLGGGWLGHAFTLHTASFNNANREIKHHLSTWLHPHTPYANKVLYLPHAAFAGVYAGCSGRIVKTVDYFRPVSRENPVHEYDIDGNTVFDWDPNNARYRRADRFVCYGGGSMTRKDLCTDINIVGSNITYGSNLYCGMDLNLPPGLIQPTAPNKMTYPSAIVANYVFGFFRMNNHANKKFLEPKSMCDVRYNVPGDEDATFNVWVSAAPQFATNPKTGYGDIQICRGNSVVSHVGEGQGEVLYGMPSMFTQREMTAGANPPLLKQA